MEVEGKVLPRETEEIIFFSRHVLFFCGEKKKTRNLQKDKSCITISNVAVGIQNYPARCSC